MPSANGRVAAGYFGAFMAVGSVTAVLGSTLLRLAGSSWECLGR